MVLLLNDSPRVRVLATLVAAAMLTGTALLSSCDSQSPIDDDSIAPHYLYTSGLGFDQVRVLIPPDTSIIETLSGFKSVWNLAVGPSDETLYVGTRDNFLSATGTLYAVEVGSWRSDPILDKPVDIFTVPGRPVLVIEVTPEEPGRPVGLVNEETQAVTFIDTLDVQETIGYGYQSLVFDPQEPVFYTLDSDYRVFAYDYERRAILRTYDVQLSGAHRHLAVSQDGQFLYVAGGPVIDLVHDDVVGIVGGNHLGSIAVIPEQQRLYLTDPGGYIRIDFPPPTGKVYVYDTVAYQMIREIDVVKAYPYSHYTDPIVLTLDGRRAYVSNWINALFTIDTKTHKITGVMVLAIRPEILALGPLPAVRK